MNKLAKKLPDGNKCCAVAGSVEATFNSASMKYVLLIGGIRYDVVTIDYS